jgi:hypothetical protein
MSNLLLYIVQNEKIASKLAAKIAGVDGPLYTFHCDFLGNFLLLMDMNE